MSTRPNHHHKSHRSPRQFTKPPLSLAAEQDLADRAMAAYFRAGRGNSVLPQPSQPTVCTVAGKGYVVLNNCNGTLAVYRVLNSGKLKRLMRWPTQVAQA